ncbi:MAG TPA: hypothetical protein VLR49_04600 [Ferruginibacter sp.]|nr:hypothetical protein [Ferruginibacter sp.]
MRILYTLICALFVFQIQAQKAVLLKKANGQQQAFYGNQPFIDANTAASNEDTIYLPGGTFETSDLNKRLTIYGAGHYPDSTPATGKTIVANAFIIDSNADSLLLEGIQFNGSITVNSNVNYLVLRRTILLSVLNFPYAPVCANIRLEGNVFRSTVYLTYSANTLLVNNIFEGTVSSAKNGDLFRNNIFITPGYPVSACQYALFENNVFKYTNDPNFLQNAGNSYNTFSYNAFTLSPIWFTNPNNNNYINADPATIFVNQTGTEFNYAHNYHLQTPGAFLGADATQCGLYGGLFVYKEGAVPANPHIRQKTIANATDVNGNLNVNITVAAQNN